MKELSIIIVSYNTRNLTRNCLDSIVKNTEGLEYEIIVVDNGSTDGSRRMLKDEFPGFKYIYNRENAGFAKANNQGIRIADGENILLLNSDTLILDNCLHEISEVMKKKLDAGILGCKILNSDGTIQFSCFHAPNLLTELLFFTKVIIKDTWDPFTYYKDMRYWDHSEMKEVDWIAGCFFWIRKKTLEETGLLDEKFFLYYEETEFCRRVKANSAYKIYYYPYSEIIHFKGASVDAADCDAAALGHCYESARYYFEKTGGRNIARILSFLSSAIWRLELVIFYIFRFNEKFNRKFIMLKKLTNP